MIVASLPVMSMYFSFTPANLRVEAKKISTTFERKLKKKFAALKMTAPVKTIEADF